MIMIKQTFPGTSIGVGLQFEFDFGFLDELLQLDCFAVADQTADLELLLGNVRLQQWIASHDRFLILGTGGSSLGGQCIHAVASASAPKVQKKIEFINNLDPCTLQNTIYSIDKFSKNLPANTGILCISKSGETLETIAQLLLFRDHWHGDFRSDVVIITENKPSTLKKIASEDNLLGFDHPQNIGGRFSVLSIVGMLPALLCGIDPSEIRAGARSILHGDLESVKTGAAFVAKNFRRNITNHVAFIYSDKLALFGEWLSQLYAESSGKNGIGITPIMARGSIDQHSQLQLYLDGFSDKMFTFLQEKIDCNLRVPVFDNLPNAAYISDKKISDIFAAQCHATQNSLLEKNRPLRNFEFSEVTPRVLGELFMHFMLEVFCVCKLINVNPFDQPAVERGKTITKTLLNTKRG